MKAKIILNDKEIEVYICYDEKDGYCFNSSLTRKNSNILNWLFAKIDELKYLGYSIKFENNDKMVHPADAF